MPTIRPNLPQPLPPSAKPAGADARAAFFQAALAKTQAVAPVAPQPPALPARTAAPQAQRAAEPQAAQPPYRRPGSLLDIKV